MNQDGLPQSGKSDDPNYIYLGLSNKINKWTKKEQNSRLNAHEDFLIHTQLFITTITFKFLQNKCKASYRLLIF